MKKTDITILSYLRQNGRMPLTELSRKTGLPISTLHERIKKHIKNELIKPIALLSFNQLGQTARAHVLLAVEQDDRAKLFSHLEHHPNVNSLFRINNGWNLLAECVFSDMHSLEDFIDKLEHQFKITKKDVHYTLDELKREAFLRESTPLSLSK